MTQFDKDYKKGKQSEIDSYPDFKRLFKLDNLQLDPEMFAHFDYHDDKNMIELKTRDDVKFINGEFHYTTRKGKKMILDSLYFDAPKMRFAYQYNKRKRINNQPEKDFFLVWKCSGKYFYWRLNWGKKEYYVEEQNQDFGHGYKQVRDIINVKTEFIKRL